MILKMSHSALVKHRDHRLWLPSAHALDDDNVGGVALHPVGPDHADHRALMHPLGPQAHVAECDADHPGHLTPQWHIAVAGADILHVRDNGAVISTFEAPHGV